MNIVEWVVVFYFYKFYVGWVIDLFENGNLFLRFFDWCLEDVFVYRCDIE